MCSISRNLLFSSHNPTLVAFKHSLAHYLSKICIIKSVDSAYNSANVVRVHSDKHDQDCKPIDVVFLTERLHSRDTCLVQYAHDGDLCRSIGIVHSSE